MSTGLIITIAYPGWRRKRTLYAVRARVIGPFRARASGHSRFVPAMPTCSDLSRCAVSGFG